MKRTCRQRSGDPVSLMTCPLPVCLPPTSCHLHVRNTRKRKMLTPTLTDSRAENTDLKNKIIQIMDTDDRVRAREFTSGTRLDKHQYPRFLISPPPSLPAPPAPPARAPPHAFTHGGSSDVRQTRLGSGHCSSTWLQPSRRVLPVDQSSNALRVLLLSRIDCYLNQTPSPWASGSGSIKAGKVNMVKKIR